MVKTDLSTCALFVSSIWLQTLKCVKLFFLHQDFEMNGELKTGVICLLEEVLRDPDLLSQERKAATNLLRYILKHPWAPNMCYRSSQMHGNKTFGWQWFGARCSVFIFPVYRIIIVMVAVQRNNLFCSPVPFPWKIRMTLCWGLKTFCKWSVLRYCVQYTVASESIQTHFTFIHFVAFYPNTTVV